MKRTAYLTLYWHPQSQHESTRIRQRVEEMLERYRLKTREFPPDLDFCRIIPLNANSEKFKHLMEEIENWQEIDDVNLKIWRSYNPSELSSAPLLEWGPTNQAIEDDYYTLHFKEGQAKGIAPYARDCPVCRAHLEQVRDIWVDVRRMGQRDLSLTYSFEIILSARLARMLQEAGFTGFTLRPVWDYRKPYQGEPKLYQLVVTNVLPPMASPPTEFEQEQHCEVCSTKTQYLKHTHFWGRIQYYEETDIYYAPEVLEQAADFNATHERIGGLPDGHPLVLISQRVYRWLKEQRIKGWSARPVYLVESGTLKSE